MSLGRMVGQDVHHSGWVDVDVLDDFLGTPSRRMRRWVEYGYVRSGVAEEWGNVVEGAILFQEQERKVYYMLLKYQLEI